MKTKTRGAILGLTLLSFPLIAFGSWSLPSSYGLPGAGISYIVEGILMWLLSLLGIVGIIGFAISGIMYLIAAGDSDMIDRAKNGMKYSIIGIIVGLVGFIAVRAIDAMLRGYTGF